VARAHFVAGKTDHRDDASRPQQLRNVCHPSVSLEENAQAR
jgi:hypothetical protein